MRQQRSQLSRNSARLEERLLLRSGGAAVTGRTRRRGFSLLEFLVAMLLFGVTIGGLFPLIAMYSRMLGSLEQRPDEVSRPLRSSNAYRVAKSDPQVPAFDAEWYQVSTQSTAPNAGEWVRKRFLVPFSDSDSNQTVDAQLSAADAWARRLGASASVRYNRPADRAAPPDRCNSPENLPEPTKATDANPAGVDAADTTTTDYSESPPPTCEAPLVPWTTVTGAYGGNNAARQSPVNATNTPTATWTLNIPSGEAGWYQVQATGLVPGTMPAACFYKLSTDAGVNWSDPITPSLTFGQSSTWQPLVTKYFDDGTVTVQLTTDTLGSAIADRVRLVRCSVQITSWPKPTATTATATVDIKPAVRIPPP